MPREYRVQMRTNFCPILSRKRLGCAYKVFITSYFTNREFSWSQRVNQMQPKFIKKKPTVYKVKNQKNFFVTCLGENQAFI